jgi:hypothetical protein
VVRSVRRPERHHPRPPPLNIAPSAPLAHPSPSPGMAWATGVVSCRRRAGRGAARSHLSPLTSPPAAWTRHWPPRACPQTGWTRVAIALDADRRCGRRRRRFRGRGDRDGSRGGPGIWLISRTAPDPTPALLVLVSDGAAYGRQRTCQRYGGPTDTTARRRERRGAAPEDAALSTDLLDVENESVQPTHAVLAVVPTMIAVCLRLCRCFYAGLRPPKLCLSRGSAPLDGGQPGRPARRPPLSSPSARARDCTPPTGQISS